LGCPKSSIVLNEVPTNEYMAEYMLRRYHERRKEALEILGGRCSNCKTTKRLEIDHVDRTKKSFNISQMWSVSRARFLAELKKCQLLCRLCHQDKTTRERGQVPARGTHGTLSSYRYCKCDDCRDAKSRHNREYRRKPAPALAGR
jgi:hypothetical protein